MPLLWWLRLLLLILIQILFPNKSTYKLYAEASFSFKSSQQLGCSIVKYPPCQMKWPCLDCYILKDPAKIDGNNDIPTLTPVQVSQVNRTGGGRTTAATVGGIVAALIVIFIVVIVYICLMRVKRLMRQTSDTASSTASPTVEMGRGDNSQYANALATDHMQNNARQLTILELEQATSNFSQSNIIGEGRFGLVYKGLLQDGSIVAIKRRISALTPDFTSEVKQIAHIHHMNLVKLIGYYEDGYQQLLVYEYLPNGHVGKHLYDSEGLPRGKLDLWRRLSIALGASKGLKCLHSLVPPLVHTNFRTRNVLLDGSYNVKVSDYGFCKLQKNGDHQAGSSSNIDCFLDPELSSSKNYSEQSDVYSFGVFLLELISGREAHNKNMSTAEENLVFQFWKARNREEMDKLIDITLGDHEKHGARRIMNLVLVCMEMMSYRRPSMGQIVQELEHIQGEIAHLYSQLNEEDIGAVTLGSELFQ